MYSMWHPLLLWYLSVRTMKIDINDFFTPEELREIVFEAMDETLTEWAWEYMTIHNVTLYEAKAIIAQQLAGD